GRLEAQTGRPHSPSRLSSMIAHIGAEAPRAARCRFIVVYSAPWAPGPWFLQLVVTAAPETGFLGPAFHHHPRALSQCDLLFRLGGASGPIGGKRHHVIVPTGKILDDVAAHVS